MKYHYTERYIGSACIRQSGREVQLVANHVEVALPWFIRKVERAEWTLNKRAVGACGLPLRVGLNYLTYVARNRHEALAIAALISPAEAINARQRIALDRVGRAGSTISREQALAA